MDRKWKKRMLALLLAAALALLTACAQEQPAPTEAPTETPVVTEAPTEAPTEEPTEAPTEEPTEEPTEAPTEEPTEAPTEAATEEPTEEPTEAPTEEPTEALTEEPTEAPTEEPTEAATEEPTEAPTEEPTEAPTEEPTEAPTEAASEEPTEAPTEAATEEPAGVKAEGTATQQAAALNMSDENVYAYVNRVALTKADVESIADNMISYYSQYGYDPEDPEFVYQVHEVAMNYGVEMVLINQKAAEWGLDQLTAEETAKLESDTDTQWENLISTAIQYYSPVAEDATEDQKLEARESALKTLADMGYTKEGMLKDNRDSIIYDRVYERMIADVAVTDEEVEASFNEKAAADEEAYKDNVSAYEYNNMLVQYGAGEPSYYMPAGFRGVIQILLKADEELMNKYTAAAAQLEEQEQQGASTPSDLATPSDFVTADDVEAARLAILASVQPTVDTIRSRLDAGEPFEALIEEYNTDPGMQDPENLKNGYSVHKDSTGFDPSFVQAAFSVDNIGDVAEPAVSSLGYGVYIVKYLRDVPEGAIELTDELRETIRGDLLEDRQNEMYQTTMDLWRDESEIVYTTAGTAFVTRPAEEAPLATPSDLE